MTTIKVKAPTFEPFGKELDASVAFWQAANALDLATYFAVQSGNIDKLLDVCATWVGIGERLARGFEVEEDEEIIPDNPEKPPFGFRSPLSDNAPAEKIPGIIVESDNEEENEESA